MGSKLLGNQQDLYDITLYCLLIMPKHLQNDKRFELIILVSNCTVIKVVVSNKGGLVLLSVP